MKRFHVHIEVAQLGSGWAAVMIIKDENGLDCQQTGIGRYKTRTGAENEARSWAEAEELEYREI